MRRLSYKQLVLLAAIGGALNLCAPSSDALLLAEPFSLTAFFISLAFTAGSYALNYFLRPKPPTITRGQQTGELYIQNADEGGGVPEIYGCASTATAQAITWTGLVNCVVNADNSLEKTSGADNCFENASGSGDGGGYSVQTFATGVDFEVSWNFGSDTEGRMFGGLDASPNVTDYTSVSYNIHVSDQNNTSGTPHPPHSIFIYENGVFKGAWDGVYAHGDTLRITRQSGVVKYWHKGDLLYTSSLSVASPLHFVGSIACLNKTIDDVVMSTSGAATKGGIKHAGTIIWASPIRKVVTKEKKGGKGAPKQTVETITYYLDVAILVGRGRQRLKAIQANADKLLDLDAAIGSQTGGLDEGSVTVATYSTENPPLPGGASLLAHLNRFTGDSLGTVSGTIAGGGGASIRFYEGNYEQLPDPLIEADKGAGEVPAYRGWAYCVIENFNLSKYGGVPTFLFTTENVDICSLADLADDLCERAGIEPGDRDFSPFDSQSLSGLIVQQPQAPRETLELASTPYAAEFYEAVDGVLTGTFLGSSSVVTVNEDHLGMVEGLEASTNGDLGNKIEWNIKDEVQLARQLNVTAFDSARDYESGSQPAYRMTGFAQGVESVNLPMTLTSDQMRQAAERLLYQQHIARESATARLPWRYAWVNPTNIITISETSATTRARVLGFNGALPGLQEFNLVDDEVLIYSQAITGTVGGGGYIPPVASAPPNSIVLLFDQVWLRDADENKIGFYAAITPTTNADSWNGAGLYRDTGDGYELLETFPSPSIAGTLVNPINTAAVNTWDDTNTITVDLYNENDALESSTDDAVLDGANAILLGDEVITFVNASQVSARRWNLTRLRRGLRCSTPASHAANERFLLLDTTLRFIEDDLSEVGETRTYKAVTANQNIADASSTSWTFTAPYLNITTPADYAVTFDATRNEVLHTWTPISDECVSLAGLIYEIYEDNGGSPGAFLWSGNTNSWRETVNESGTRMYLFRAKTNASAGSYVMGMVTVEYTPGGNAISGMRWEAGEDGQGNLDYITDINGVPELNYIFVEAD